MKPSEIELRDCPMCGGKAAVTEITDNWMYVGCAECGLKYPVEPLEGLNYIIEKWNKRAYDSKSSFCRDCEYYSVRKAK